MKRAKFTLPCGHEFIVSGTSGELARMLLDCPSGTRVQVLGEAVVRDSVTRSFYFGDVKNPVAKA